MAMMSAPGQVLAYENFQGSVRFQIPDILMRRPARQKHHDDRLVSAGGV
jgi:hypothetical protein